mmetsp:Transcript_7380/g.23441  ORF Transcript_7380/g.23441 Transcript_7380/m.23441 type:complete len:708 (-) Transcript_7380:427-2550(-)
MTGSCAATVLDFDPRESDAEAAERTRRLLGRVLSSQGAAGLASALHVSAPRAAQLKHRVACVTCRSRLDGLTSSLAVEAVPRTAAAAKALATETIEESLPLLSDGPLPLAEWLAADSSRGLTPAPRALRDLGALAAFLASYGGAAPPNAGGAEDVPEEASRRGGRSVGVVRCPHHAPRAVARAAVAAAAAAAAGGACSSSGSAAASPTAAAAAANTVCASTLRERERYVALLEGGTTDAEWRQLGSVDIDNAMCDLFGWLGDRGLCSGCVDAVTGALLEVRRAVTGTCTCSRCLGLCVDRKAATPAPPQLPRLAGSPPEFVRVQGRLRAICGVYRLEALPFNDRPVYKKERAEAYLLYTTLKDWMVSGRADAGGSRCEGWAYVTDPAETPDDVCGVWKVSGPRGWEEDRSLCVTAFEGLPEGMRAGLGYDDGSVIAQRLTADERGILVVPLQEPEVLDEVLWAPDEPPPGRTRSGACAHILTAETAQRELRSWLRWLLRERLDAQRRRVLAQAQVGASLCRLFACAALQQLEQAAEEPQAMTRGRDKKGRARKGVRAAPRDAEAAEDAAGAEDVASLAEVDVTELADGAGMEFADCCAEEELNPDASACAASPATSASGTCGLVDSDESVSTRASSEDPPDAQKARIALGVKRLMEQMGWRPGAVVEGALNGAEVAAWHEQHPRYRQAVREERQRIKTQFQQWAGAP